MVLPAVTPMPLLRRRDAFDHRDWLFELKWDGFRALAYVDSDGARLVSRKGIRFRRFDALCAEVVRVLGGHAAVLDGEVVCLDGEGRSRFDALMSRRAAPCFYTFDLLWLDGRDLRRRTLLERKRRLARLLHHVDGRVRYLDHVVGRGRDLYTEVPRRRADASCRCGARGARDRIRAQNEHTLGLARPPLPW